MQVTVNPSKASGKITAPPSKSMAHRALICGALSEKSVICNIDFSKDIEATLGCLKILGADVKINQNTVTLCGININSIPDNIILDCIESGSTLRFLIPLCMASGKRVTLTGAKRLFERPLNIYEDIAKKQNVLFEKNENSLTVCGNLKSGEYAVPGNVSSQFITGLLFALPKLKGDSKLTVTGRFESEPYIDLTLDVLNSFGIGIKRIDNTFYISGNRDFKALNYTVEGDCSNAAFLEAFNYLGGEVEVEGLKPDTLQGDRVYKRIFEGLKNGKKEFDLSDCPDLAPVSFAVASLYGGAVFTGTKRLKIKESDRALAMQQELLKFGIKTEVFENSVVIKNGNLKRPTELLNSHNDHRIAMALTLLLTVTGGGIYGAECVAKSYPLFYNKISKIGIDINETD